MDIEIVKDLRSRFGEIRNQGQRPTCLVFAASDCHSFAREITEPFSVEYAFYHAVQRTPAKDRNRGVGLNIINETLSQDGQPLENGWAYLKDLSDSDLWEPPSSPGDLFYGKANVLPAGLSPIYESIDKDIPVVLIIYISRNFQLLSPNMVLHNSNSDPKVGLHAVVAVGYGNSKDGKCLLIRNSWGNSWGDSGFAWIHEDYIDAQLNKAAALEKL